MKYLIGLLLILLSNAVVANNLSPHQEVEQLLKLEATVDKNTSAYFKIVDAISDRLRFIDERAKDDVDYILVNIGSQRLDIIDNLRVSSSQRVIVGRDSRRTPIFSDEITHIVTRPYWNIPRSLARKDILPKLRSNPALVESDGFEMIDIKTGATILPFDLNMDLNRYRIRQKPSDVNALGKVKFMFAPNPNRSIFLHGTPLEHLFDESVRRYSSGCIRVENSEVIERFIMGRKLPKNNKEDQWIKPVNTTKVHIVDWPIYFENGELVLDNSTNKKFEPSPTLINLQPSNDNIPKNLL